VGLCNFSVLKCGGQLYYGTERPLSFYLENGVGGFVNSSNQKQLISSVITPQKILSVVFCPPMHDQRFNHKMEIQISIFELERAFLFRTQGVQTILQTCHPDGGVPFSRLEAALHANVCFTAITVNLEDNLSF
jgi:hypothetical protein